VICYFISNEFPGPARQLTALIDARFSKLIARKRPCGEKPAGHVPGTPICDFWPSFVHCGTLTMSVIAVGEGAETSIAATVSRSFDHTGFGKSKIHERIPS
jgi:hypothetical protein